MSKSLANSTVLVTGGAGLIGSHIVDQLIEEQPREIRVLDDLSRGRRDNLAHAESRHGITFIEADVRDRHAVREAVAGCDYVVHQAAIRITRCAEQPRDDGARLGCQGGQYRGDQAVAGRVKLGVPSN